MIKPPNCKYIDWKSELKIKCLHLKMKGLFFQKPCPYGWEVLTKCKLMEEKYARPKPPSPQRIKIGAIT